MILAGLVATTLIVAAISQGRVRITAAGMMLPVLLVRTDFEFPLGVGSLIVASLFAVASYVAWYGMIPARWSVQASNAVISGVVVGLTLLIARLAAGLTPVLGVVVFAVLFAGLEKLGSTRNPFGEWGSLAHSQTKQRWALWTGRHGPHAVTFVLTFVGAGVGFAWSTQSIAAGAVAVVAAVVVGLGTVRAKQSKTDRASSAVAGLVEQDSSFFALFLPKFLAAKTESDEYWSNFCRATKHSLIDLARRTEQVAEDGADLVVWAEGAGFLCSSQYEWALQRIIESTKKAGCVVVATWLLLDRNERTFTNTATVILPNGEIATVYAKAHPVPGIEAERTKMAPSVVEAVETKFGRLAVIICFDADHPDSWSQLHDADIDVVAIPASDWTAIGALHADMARLRARSVGAALIRPARNGHSTVVDKNGRMLSTVDHTVSREPDLVAVL